MKLIELPKTVGAPGNLSDAVFVPDSEVRKLLAGIAERKRLRDEQFQKFARRIENIYGRTS